MKRWTILSVVVLGLVLGTACDKPSPEACEKALRNMQTLLGTQNLDTTTAALQGEVRRCRGGSTKQSVECAINATTLDELAKCDFEKTGAHKLGSAGSAADSTGSAK